MVNVQPLHDKIIVKRDAAEEVTASGIIIPGTAQAPPPSGTIVAVGTNKDLVVKVGDKVFFGGHCGLPVPTLSKEYILMREIDVIGIIKEEVVDE